MVTVDRSEAPGVIQEQPKDKVAENVQSKLERKRKKWKTPLVVTLAMLGGLAAIAGNLGYLWGVDLAPEERVAYAEQAVSAGRNEAIESGDYQKVSESVSPEIQDSVHLYAYEVGKEDKTATAVMVSEYEDWEHIRHAIFLIDAHAQPGMTQNTVNFKTADGIYTGITTCLAYDHIGMAPNTIDINQPIRDLALCDFKIIIKPEVINHPLKPLELSNFDTEAIFSQDTEYDAYGFPIGYGVTIEERLDMQQDAIVAPFKFNKYISGDPYFTGSVKGLKFGPGGSGGPMIDMRTNKVVGLMKRFHQSDYTEFMQIAFNKNIGQTEWTIEPIPRDIADKISVFKDQVINQGTPKKELGPYTYINTLSKLGKPHFQRSK
jgi:hypothetical protein